MLYFWQAKRTRFDGVCLSKCSTVRAADLRFNFANGGECVSSPSADGGAHEGHNKVKRDNGVHSASRDQTDKWAQGPSVFIYGGDGRPLFNLANGVLREFPGGGLFIHWACGPPWSSFAKISSFCSKKTRCETCSCAPEQKAAWGEILIKVFRLAVSIRVHLLRLNWDCCARYRLN